MFKKLFSCCGLISLLFAGLGVSTLSSCGSSEVEEENIAGIMTLADFSSGRDRFLLVNQFGRFFFVDSDGFGSTSTPTASNQVLLTGRIDVDGNLFPVSIIYTTNEEQRPDGLPTIGRLELTLTNTGDKTSTVLIAAIFAEFDATANPSISGEPIVFDMNFETGKAVMQSTVEYDTLFTTDDGNEILGRDTSERSQVVDLSVIPSSVEAL